MPCQDVTESIRVVIDPNDRIRGYEFTKRSCGQGVGTPDLIAPQIVGRPLDRVLHYSAEGFLRENPIPAEEPDRDTLEFLLLKHLFAVQGALEVLTGKEPGGKDDPCATASVTHDGDATVVDARIAVDIVVERIRACGGCASCGRNSA